MATNNNVGPVTIAKSMNDVTNNYYNISLPALPEPDQQPPTKIFKRNEISLKPVQEPHRSFTGRVDFIDSSIEYLSHLVTDDAQIQFPFLVIHALGGYGKTQTAKKIASVCRKQCKFQHFIWIDSEHETSIKKCFVDVRRQIGLAPPDESFQSPNFDLLMHRLYDFLVGRNDEKFLIIFDNVEDFDKILEYLPLNYRASNVAVLMTSQLLFTQHSYGNVRNQRLDLMLEEEAMQLVKHILGASTMDSDEDKELLVKESGRIALVLCMMSSSIQFQRKYKSHYGIKDYLKEMNDQPIRYCDESNALDLTYKKSLQKIVRFAVDKLNAVGEAIGQIAVKIFDRVSYCSSSNQFDSVFVINHLRDICDEAKRIDFKLPMGSPDDLQIVQMAVEKLAEFSLAELSDCVNVDYRWKALDVHRWIQASRRLDLKNSGDEWKVLKAFLLNEPQRNGENNLILWQHVVDHTDLVKEFYIKAGNIPAFPLGDVDLLERIFCILGETAGPKWFVECPDAIINAIKQQIRVCSLDSIKYFVGAIDYDVGKNSRMLMSSSILHRRFDVAKWLVNEKLFAPEDCYVCECFKTRKIGNIMPDFLEELRNLKLDLVLAETEKKTGKNLLQQRVENVKICWMLSALDDSHWMKFDFCQFFKKNGGKNQLKRLLCPKLNESEPTTEYGTKQCVEFCEIVRIILSSLKKSEANTELNQVLEKYSKNILLECLSICCQTDLQHRERLNYPRPDWNHLHHAALNNELTAISSIDSALVESTTSDGWTPLMCAASEGAREATTVLLEKYSANVNAVDTDGCTPLGHAIKNYLPEIVRILLDHGAKTHWTMKSGESVHALHEIVKCFPFDDTSTLEQIVEAVLASEDCDVSVIDLDGNNVLHLLVYCYYVPTYEPNYRVLQMILSANPALVHMLNNDGHTPPQLAKTILAKFGDDPSLRSFISETDKNCENIS